MTIKIISTLMVVLILALIWWPDGREAFDHQTNLPLGLYARTKGDALEVGYYENKQWRRQTGPHRHLMGAVVTLPSDPPRYVSVWMAPPYKVEVGQMSTYPIYDTREGPVVRMKRKDLGE